MSENISGNVQLDANENGSVSFATDVIATIAGLATTEIEGVAGMHGSTGKGWIVGRRDKNVKSVTKGVKVDVKEGKISVTLAIIVEFGFPIPTLSLAIQENVKKAVETMSGLEVSRVDVQIMGLSFEAENRAVQELDSGRKQLLTKQETEAEQKSEDEETGDAGSGAIEDGDEEEAEDIEESTVPETDDISDEADDFGENLFFEDVPGEEA